MGGEQGRENGKDKTLKVNQFKVILKPYITLQQESHRGEDWKQYILT